MRERPGISEQDRLLAVTTLAFDISELELWLPLLAGGRVQIAGRETAMDGQALGQMLKESGATVMQATPSTWRMLLEAGWEGDKKLKALCGGEALPAALAAELVPRVGELWNMYGPTETTIWSAVSRVEVGKAISLGEAIANTQLYVCDRHLGLQPVGVAGELLIGGDGLALGYLKREELTAEKFVRPEWSGGERVYRTGDLVRRMRSGGLEYLGRLDEQVKLRGYRIELGEIEAALNGQAGVRESVVVAREDVPGDKRLVAYVVPEGEEGIEAEALRKALKGTVAGIHGAVGVRGSGEAPLDPQRKGGPQDPSCTEKL